MKGVHGNLASDVYPVGIIAAQVAGVTTFDSPVFDMTKHEGYSNVVVYLRMGAVVAGGTIRPDVYTCDDAAGSNPVKQFEGPEMVPVANEALTVQVTGVPAPFLLVRFNRLNQNTTVVGGLAAQSAPNKAPVWAPHVTVPWF